MSAISNNPPGDVPRWWHHLSAWEVDGSLAILVPVVWWSGEQVAEGGGEGRATAKNTRSALSTSERCTQGPHAAQTEIKSRENSGSGACVFICVCVLAPSSDILGYLTTTPSIIQWNISSWLTTRVAGMWSHTAPSCDSIQLLLNL